MINFFIFHNNKLIFGNEKEPPLLREYINGLINIGVDFFNEEVKSVETDSFLLQIFKTPTNYLIVCYNDLIVYRDIYEVYTYFSKAMVYDDFRIFEEYVKLNNN
ncbi:hypothetical protein DMUE_1318 [Dictyocoela muelleri]|nr:hypothetical protein DMUE_1318 [Dictyocoela muelleri]